jgi:hypothetical protein
LKGCHVGDTHQFDVGAGAVAGDEAQSALPQETQSQGLENPHGRQKTQRKHPHRPLEP